MKENQKTAQGREQAFSALVREHKQTIYTVCYMFSQDEDEVADLFQDTLVNLWQGMDSFRHELTTTVQKGYLMSKLLRIKSESNLPLPL